MVNQKKDTKLISPGKLKHVLIMSFNVREIAEFLAQRMTEEDILTFISEHMVQSVDMHPTNQEFASVTRTKANMEFRKQVIRDNVWSVDTLLDEMTPRSIIKLSDKIWNK